MDVRYLVKQEKKINRSNKIKKASRFRNKTERFFSRKPAATSGRVMAAVAGNSGKAASGDAGRRLAARVRESRGWAGAARRLGL